MAGSLLTVSIRCQAELAAPQRLFIVGDATLHKLQAAKDEMTSFMNLQMQQRRRKSDVWIYLTWKSLSFHSSTSFDSICRVPPLQPYQRCQ